MALFVVPAKKTHCAFQTALTLKFKIRMIALYAVVPSKTLADLSEKRNQGRCCDWCISLHFVFTFFFFFFHFAIVVVAV